VEAGITTSAINKCNVSGDENDACYTAMEVRITKIITATYPMIKITRVSLQWKWE